MNLKEFLKAAFLKAYPGDYVFTAKDRMLLIELVSNIDPSKYPNDPEAVTIIAKCKEIMEKGSSAWLSWKP